jgi:biofilm PGA synthesis N-glycosyltransferase PgaC
MLTMPASWQATADQMEADFTPDRFEQLTWAVRSVRALGNGKPLLVALLPAHNEEAGIHLALDSLVSQTRPADLVVVIADNCTDDTVQIVASRPDAISVITVGNARKKAGALNQVMERLLPLLASSDSILVMDADSALDPHFLGSALLRLGSPATTSKSHHPWPTRRGRTEQLPVEAARPRIGGVGGTFQGGRGGRFVGMLQRNEYARYARDVRRLNGRVLVLTGTAALFEVGVLRHIVEARLNGEVPGGSAQVYDTNVLTEDNELTLALLHLGYGIVSPPGCVLETEVMTTWRDLWIQRVRWKRGALENLLDYGLTRITARYWGRQVLTHIGVLVTAVYLFSIAYSLISAGHIHLRPLWLAVTVIFVLERAISVRARGWTQVLLASTLVVEMTFDFVLQAAQAKALWQTLAKSEKKW